MSTKASESDWISLDCIWTHYLFSTIYVVLHSSQLLTIFFQWQLHMLLIQL